MDCLPPELVLRIFSFLDPSTVTFCRGVCKKWRILAEEVTNPLYLPRVMTRVIKHLGNGRLRDTLALRIACKLWKDGLDKLTQTEAISLNGVTSLSISRAVNSLTMLELNGQLNPFPSRIVHLHLCSGHDNPITPNQENEEQNLFMEIYGNHVHYLQVSLEHAICAEGHLLKILKSLREIKGLVISENPSPFRFMRESESCIDPPPKYRRQYTEKGRPRAVDPPSGLEPESLELANLKFLKLDDANSQLKYTDTYKLLIKNARKLKHLEVNGYYHVDLGIVTLLSSHPPLKVSLTTLRIDAEDKFCTEILSLLCNSNLKLEFLSLKINGFDFNSDCNADLILHCFLRNISPTLKRLELKLSWNHVLDKLPKILSSFPSSKYLTNLERLKLVGFKGQLDFLCHFRNLKSLMLVDYDENQEHFESEANFYSFIPSLKSLIYLPSQNLFFEKSLEEKAKLLNFMYEDDSTFRAKYCGLAQEGFP